MSITNNKALPGNSINVNNSCTNIDVGNKLLFNAGIINSVTLGNWNRLLAGPSTVIQLGTKMTANLANTISVTKGYSWHYSSQRSTISDMDIKSAFHHFQIGGGINPAHKQQLMTEEKQVRLLLVGIVTTFLVTVGITLIGIQFAPFKPIGDNGNENSISDPSTGEIIDVSATGLEFNSDAVSSIIFSGLSLLVLMIGQWILAKKMADDTTKFNTLSNLSMNNNMICAQQIPVTNDQKNQNFSTLLMNNIRNNSSHFNNSILLNSSSSANENVDAVKWEQSSIYLKEKQVLLLANNSINGYVSTEFVCGDVYSPDFVPYIYILTNRVNDATSASMLIDLEDTILYQENGMVQITFNGDKVLSDIPEEGSVSYAASSTPVDNSNDHPELKELNENTAKLILSKSSDQLSGVIAKLAVVTNNQEISMSSRSMKDGSAVTIDCNKQLMLVANHQYNKGRTSNALYIRNCKFAPDIVETFELKITRKPKDYIFKKNPDFRQPNKADVSQNILADKQWSTIVDLNRILRQNIKHRLGSYISQNV